MHFISNIRYKEIYLSENGYFLWVLNVWHCSCMKNIYRRIEEYKKKNQVISCLNENKYY